MQMPYASKMRSYAGKVALTLGAVGLALALTACGGQTKTYPTQTEVPWPSAAATLSKPDVTPTAARLTARPKGLAIHGPATFGSYNGGASVVQYPAVGRNGTLDEIRKNCADSKNPQLCVEFTRGAGDSGYGAAAQSFGGLADGKIRDAWLFLSRNAGLSAGTLLVELREGTPEGRLIADTRIPVKTLPENKFGIKNHPTEVGFNGVDIEEGKTYAFVVRGGPDWKGSPADVYWDVEAARGSAWTHGGCDFARCGWIQHKEYDHEFKISLE